MKDQKSNSGGMGFVVILGAILALFLFSSRRATSSYESYYESEPELPPLKLKPLRSQPKVYESEPLRLKPNPPMQAQTGYDNEEIREISYNEDGLPTRIVIHRHAKVS